MLKLCIIIVSVLTFSACTDKTTITFDCKDGILHYDKIMANVETGYIYQNTKQSGVVLYEDKSVVKCIK